MTTFTCQVYSTTTILRVWDTNYDTVDKETVNWLTPHIVHHIAVHFVFCEQFTDNLFVAPHTSEQQAVLTTLKEVVDMTLPLCRNASYTGHIEEKHLVDIQDKMCVEV